ncbi:MAG: NAD(P)-dependent alcohol dehydrogenase [Actinomycetota bacterium]
MSAVVGDRYGGPEVLERREVPVPSPSSAGVLIEVAASSLNALDWHFLTGTPYLVRIVNGVRRPKRTIHGADVAGTVVAVGPDVTRHRVGDRVFGETGGGGCSAYLATSEDVVARIPDGVSFDDAAATGVAGLTAIQGLVTHGAVQPGEHVLINGAAGGVGTFAVQIAKALGATVTAVCSTGNVAMVSDLGADEVVDYRTADFTDGGRRFDLMFDGVGSRTPAENISVLNPGARYVAISGPKSNPWLDPMRYVARMALAAKRNGIGFHQFTASPNHEDLVRLGELLADGSIVPAIDLVITLDEVPDGLAQIGGGHTPAKIVVHPRFAGEAGEAGDADDADGEDGSR